AANISPSASVLGLFTITVNAEDAAAEDTGFVLTVSNRLPIHADADRIVGPLSSTALFRPSPNPEALLLPPLDSVQGQLRAMQDHVAFGGVEVLRALGSRAAELTRIVFTSMLGEADDSEFGASIRTANTSTPGVYLDCQVQEREGALWINWDVVPAAF